MGRRRRMGTPLGGLLTLGLVALILAPVGILAAFLAWREDRAGEARWQYAPDARAAVADFFSCKVEDAFVNVSAAAVRGDSITYTGSCNGEVAEVVCDLAAGPVRCTAERK
jgi:hypothetical protein